MRHHTTGRLKIQEGFGFSVLELKQRSLRVRHLR